MRERERERERTDSDSVDEPARNTFFDLPERYFSAISTISRERLFLYIRIKYIFVSCKDVIEIFRRRIF